jgi:hypothetical protein
MKDLRRERQGKDINEEKEFMGRINRIPFSD